jgi:hypothetical protein
LAAEEPSETDPSPPVRALLFLVCFFLAIFVPLMLLTVWRLFGIKRQWTYLQRAEQHMERVERQNERIIELLEANAHRPAVGEAAQGVQAQRPGTRL